MRNLLVFIVVMALSGCATKKLQTTSAEIWWVNGSKVDCNGVGPMKCLQIQKSDTIQPGKWQNLYTEIEGFNFQNGYLFKIKVAEEKLNPAKVPADGSAKKYKLVEILEKTPDLRFALHDLWVLEAINGEMVKKPENDDQRPLPAIEINVTEMRVMGSDGCNRLTGSISKLENGEIELGPVAQTKKLCLDNDIPDRFNALFAQAKKYHRDGVHLIFSDGTGKELLKFKKVD
jgi:heat shock protein HslJ